MARYILSLDQGTTSSRAILFDHAGNAVRSSQIEFRQIYPHPGWVEHDPANIWASQLKVALDIVHDPGRDRSHRHQQSARNHGDLGQNQQRADTQRNRLARPAHCRILRHAQGGGIRPNHTEETGLVTDAYFSGTKVAWLLEQCRRRTRTCRSRRACIWYHR